MRFGGLKKLMENNGILEENPPDQLTNIDKQAEEFLKLVDELEGVRFFVPFFSRELVRLFAVRDVDRLESLDPLRFRCEGLRVVEVDLPRGDFSRVSVIAFTCCSPTDLACFFLNRSLELFLFLSRDLSRPLDLSRFSVRFLC